jgi:spermidine/putrescine-binding protein
MKRPFLIALIAFAAMALVSCGGAKEEAAPASPAKAAPGQVNIYIWTSYLPPEVIAGFEKRTGIKVNVDTYDSNEAVLEKLQSGVADYDIVVPSDYMMKVLIPEGLVQPLDHARLPHFKNLDPRFLNQQYDPDNGHSFPYLWGTTGIGYDKGKVKEPVDSWRALFDERYAGRILMLDDPREAFGAALKIMGRSVNETDPAVLRQAAEMLKKQKRLVRTYNSSDFANLLAAGDVDVAQGWNGEMAEAVSNAPGRLAYVVPKEGGTLWIDNVTIPKGARNLDAAYAFLDYILEPEVAATIVNGVHYAGANRAALPLVDQKIRQNSSIYPPKEVLDRCELIEDLGETTQLIDELWTEVKAQ